jgi:NAD(P)-dependent dehydrogenase (short-subunit alcohol dehydrogenase family)
MNATTTEDAGVCLITGVGPGTGAALARRFATGGYRIAMIARDQERLDALEKEIPNSRGFVCDVADADQFRATLTKVKSEMGAPKIAIHNAVRGTFATFLELDPKDFELNFQINAMGFLHLAQTVVPDMIDAGEGVLLMTGNTSAYRGKPRFAGFAPTKAAQRILAESIARDAGPKGVHVAFVAIDAVIDLPWTRKMFGEESDDFYCQPADIADECYRVAHQAKSAWSFESVIRPFGEVW